MEMTTRVITPDCRFYSFVLVCFVVDAVYFTKSKDTRTMKNLEQGNEKFYRPKGLSYDKK